MSQPMSNYTSLGFVENGYGPRQLTGRSAKRYLAKQERIKAKKASKK